MLKTHSANSAKRGKKKTPKIPVPATPVAGIWRILIKAPLVHLGLLALIAIISYSNTFQVPFIFDDRFSIVDNPVIKDLRTFLSGAGYAYNPRRFIGYLSFALNHHFGGLQVEGYHAVNLSVHILSAWLVYFLVYLTMQTPFFRSHEQASQTASSESIFPNTALLPLLVALLFVSHPVQTQAVTYIVQRVASMATLFYILALVFYVKARLTFEAYGERVPGTNGLKTARSTISLSFIFITLSIVAGLLAIRTKEIAATLPLVVVLYEFSFFGAKARKSIIHLLLLLTILIIAAGMLQDKSLGKIMSDVNDMTRESPLISRGDYLLTQFAVIVTYIRLLFFPVRQNLDYDYPIFTTLFTPRVLLSLLLLVAFIGGALYLYRRSAATSNQTSSNGLLRLVAFGIFWFFITLAVESSVIPISDVIFEHRLYLPSVGAFIAVASGALLVGKKYSSGVLLTAAGMVIVTLTAVTWQRNSVWQDELTLWRDVAEKSPKKYRPHNNLALALLLRGELDDATAEYQIAAELQPRDADARSNLGAAYLNKGWVDQAIEEFSVAIRLNPGLVIAHINLGEAYNRKEYVDKAIEAYRTAIKLKPDYAEARNNLGGAYLKKGWVDKAIEEFESALKIKPNEANFHFNLAAAYETRGWFEKAAEEYRLALMFRPEDSEARSRLEVISGREGNQRNKASRQ